MDPVGESSNGRRGRGRPPSERLTEEEKKDKKRKADKKYREDQRAALEGLTDIAPTLLDLVKWFGINRDSIQWFLGVSGNEAQGSRELMQSNREVMHSNQEVMRSNQELKARIDGLNTGLSKEVAPVAPQDNQNGVPQPTIALDGQQETWNRLFNNEEYGYIGHFAPAISPRLYSDTYRSLEEALANNEAFTPFSTSSNQNNGESFDDEVKTFYEQFDGNTKRQVKYSDFNGLEEELNKVERNFMPPFLNPTTKKIREVYGDIAKDCTLGDCATYPTLIMLYATIKEIDELKDLKDVSLPKLKVWRDAIIDAQQFNFNVDFAIVHLKRIAGAYFGSKANDPKLYERKKSLEGELDRITKMIQLREKYQPDATYFNNKPLNTGLFPQKQI